MESDLVRILNFFVTFLKITSNLLDSYMESWLLAANQDRWTQETFWFGHLKVTFLSGVFKLVVLPRLLITAIFQLLFDITDSLVQSSLNFLACCAVLNYTAIPTISWLLHHFSVTRDGVNANRKYIKAMWYLWKFPAKLFWRKLTFKGFK